MAPPAVTVKDVVVAGFRTAGCGVQVLGGFVVPATQLRVMKPVYPFSAFTVPLKVAVLPSATVCGVFEIAMEKSLVNSRLNCQIPRP